MNIFYLDRCPVKSAEMSCDKHVVKMILESAQLLCTVHRVSDGIEYYDKTAKGRKIKRWKHPNSNLEATLYKAGWLKHPSTQWLFESPFNYVWLYEHMMALNEEYKKRYNHTKDHVTIHSGATVCAGSGVVGDVAAGKTVLGYPACDARKKLKEWVTLRKLSE